MQLGPNFKYGSVMLVIVFALATALMLGLAQFVDVEKQAAAEETTGPAGGPVSVRVVAKDSKFDKRSIAASPGVPVTVTLDNQDAGVLHNIAFYTNRSATTKIAGTDIAAGPIVQELRFSAPSAPGNAFYRCDVHPDTMNGTLVVK